MINCLFKGEERENGWFRVLYFFLRMCYNNLRIFYEDLFFKSLENLSIVLFREFRWYLVF